MLLLLLLMVVVVVLNGLVCTLPCITKQGTNSNEAAQHLHAMPRMQC
jgi:hypothetical protein